jgi:hypothetical protein
MEEESRLEAKHLATFKVECRASLRPVTCAFEHESLFLAVEIRTAVVPTVSNACNRQKITFPQSLTVWG